MEIRYPKYYHEFACIASACPDSCCKEWEVDVDPETAAMYRTLPGALGDRLRSVLREEADGWASMSIADRRCPMWRSDGLCAIQAELGHDALCGTCRDYPRLRHDYGSFTELGLELSCPEAARLILQGCNPEFVTETVPGSSTPEYDTHAMAYLLHSRDHVLTLLRNSKLSMTDSMTAMLLYGYEVHEAMVFSDPMPDPRGSLDYMCTASELAQKGSMEDIFELFKTLEILTPGWQGLLEAGPRSSRWLPEHRALACYLVERYWLQAVSDLDLRSRVKFIAVSCLMVRHLACEPLRAAQLYSKEIENDADNVDALLDAAYTSSALTDVKLLGLLLN